MNHLRLYNDTHLGYSSLHCLRPQSHIQLQVVFHTCEHTRRFSQCEDTSGPQIPATVSSPSLFLHTVSTVALHSGHYRVLSGRVILDGVNPTSFCPPCNDRNCRPGFIIHRLKAFWSAPFHATINPAWPAAVSSSCRTPAAEEGGPHRSALLHPNKPDVSPLQLSAISPPPPCSLIPALANEGWGESAPSGTQSPCLPIQLSQVKVPRPGSSG